MIIGQFAFLAVVPVAIIVGTTFRRATDARLRRFAALLAAVYAVPWIVWTVRPHPAPSLSKDMNPVLAGGIVVIAAAYLVILLRRR